MIQIIKAEYKRDYCIDFTFSDECSKIVDFYPFLSMPYQNSCVSKYLNKSLFKAFEIINNRDISWNNYEMCFRFEELYSGKIEPTLLIEVPGYVCEPLEEYDKHTNKQTIS
jgi:hypothetical protein